jgi:hypothetical protein
MKLTKTFYYQYGSEYASQDDYETNIIPSEIVDTVASIYINIPFKVSKIIVKKMSYVSGQNGSQGNAGSQNYVTATSSLVGGRPVGMVFRDSQFSMNTLQNIEHTFQIPKLINGFYDLTFFSNAGNPYQFSLSNPYYPFYYTETLVPPFLPIYNYWFDSFHITMEFNSEEEL